MPPPEELREFMKTVSGATDRIEAAVERGVANGTVRVVEGTGEPERPTLPPEQIMSKVLAFLDNKLKSPMTVLGPLRHKLFLFRIPTQQEMLDASAFAGTTLRDPNAPQLAAEQLLNVIGELQKACIGFVYEKSIDVGVLRQNIAEPTKWPPLREPDWLLSRDPYMINGEVLPLWALYQEWRREVVPTVAELDFYYANQE